MRAGGLALNFSKERESDSKSVGENLSSLPIKHMVCQKSLAKEKEVNSGENISELRRK